VLLATAHVKIRTDHGRSVVVRALLDQGSEATFISENVAQKLRAKRIRMSIAISAVGGVSAGMVRQAVSISLSPIDGDHPTFSTTALILNSLTSYTPGKVSDVSSLSHLSQLKWADSDPTSSEPIHLIIGADLYSDIILSGVQKGNAGQPIAQNSAFGWIISGLINVDMSTTRSSAHLVVHHCTSLYSLSEEIQRFWETEEIPSSLSLTPQDQQCEDHFCSTRSRDSSGRYIVRLPFKTTPPVEIGQSFCSADRQVRSLFNRLNSQPSLKEDYQQFMRDYIELGHMHLVSDLSNKPSQKVYLPHHPVIRTNSATTRLRVVFNASSATSNGTSLNDHLLPGPKLQTDLPAIIIQWRQFRYVYTADIAKMYRQIRVNTQDLDYQQIL